MNNFAIRYTKRRERGKREFERAIYTRRERRRDGKSEREQKREGERR